MSKPKIEYYDNRDEFVFAAVQTIYETAVKCVKEKGRFTLVLAGGTTPRPVYEALAQGHFPMPWDKTHIFFGDERAVIPTDPQANYFMAKAVLLDRINIPEKNIHRIPSELFPPNQAARKYEVEISNFFDTPRGVFPSFDLILLGVGTDGHTASLFPGHKSLSAKRRAVVDTPEPDMYPRVPRITMTLPLINAAERVVFLVKRKGKEEVVDALLEGGEKAAQFPASQVNPQGSLGWIVRTS